MQDEGKPKKQLIIELHQLREQLAELEKDKGEPKLAEQRLRESEEKFRLAFQTCPDSINLNRVSDGRYLDINEGFTEIMGYTREDVIGKSSLELNIWYDPKDRERLVTALKCARFMENMEAKFRGKDGRIRIGLMSARLLQINHEDVILSITRDITERKQAEQSLRESEEQFRTLVGSAPDAIFIQVDGRFAYVNDAAIRLYGATSEKELVGREIVERVHPDYREKAQEHIRSVNKERKPAPLMEQKHLKLDGTIIYVEAHSASIKYQRNEGALVFVRDITERKRTEESLLISEDRYRRLFEDAVLGIFRSTPDGKIINVNPAYARMFGFDLPEEVKIQVNDVAADLYADPSRRNEVVRMILDAERPILAENLYRRKDGNTFTGNLHAWSVRDREGKFLYLEGFVEDITERKRAEEEKEKLVAQLLQAQKLEAIGILAGGIAHDFNNILVPIMGYAEMALIRTPRSNPIRHGLEEILNAALRARDLVKQILTFGRSGKEQQKIPVEISSVVKEALKLLKALLPSSIEIRQNIEKCAAFADVTQIHQVLINLCTNAAHAMGEKGVLGVSLSHVNLSEGDLTDQSIVNLKPGPYLKLCVSDTGSGMDTSTLQRIFDPYFTTKEVGKGSGLGLAVVHGIVKRHDGAIAVESEPGRGSTFSVYIPAVEANTFVVVKNGLLLPTGRERILLIDDEQSVVETGTAILERLGYKVTPETNGPRALEIFGSSPGEFDLIITDYTMPKLTGTDLSTKIRQIRPDIPIILCTGFSEQITATVAMDLGVEFVMKPFSMKEIAEVVRKVLGVQEF
jgi:PAS domain S-box-containing protein